MDVIEPAKQDVAEALVRSASKRSVSSRLLLRPAAESGPLPAAFDAVLLPDAFCHENSDGLTGPLDPVLPAPLPDVPVLLDLDVSRVASDGAAATAHPELFPRRPPSLALDPRQDFSDTCNDAQVATPEDADAVGRYWGEVLRGLNGRGVSGARLLGLARVADGLRLPLLRAVRASAPGVVLIVDTAGVPWGETASFAGLGLDGVLSSLAWWDGKADWFAAELALLRGVAPVLAAMPANPAGDARRLLGLAVADGIGWIVPDGAVAPDEAARLAAIADQTRGLGLPQVLSGPGQAVTAILRGTTDDPRTSHDATLLLLNTSASASATVDPAAVLPWTGGAFSAFAPLAGTDDPTGHEKLVPGRPVTLPPAALCAFRANRLHDGTPLPLDEQSALDAGRWPRLALEAPSPAVDGGAFPVKRTAGDTVEVEIDVIGDGHDMLAAALQWQGPGDIEWHETPMRLLGNDRWQASFPLERRGPHRYRVEAWRDVWATYRHELGAKHKAGVPTALEIVEGMALVREAAARVGGTPDGGLGGVRRALDAADEDARRTILLSDELAASMAAADARPFGVRSAEIPVDAERTGAGFASWYEVFPRSMADDASRHGSFADVERHLPRIRAMGFDVLYFPPIHPIGRLNRKGPNNTLTPGPEDVGSPYAVGSAEGGHDAIHPQLGTLAEFLHLREAAEAAGLELALDFAIQCAPDHPWLREHKDWFDWRPDGTIRYAENPPKKYQDIVNVDFYVPKTENGAGSVPGLWMALANVVLFWCSHGIRLFRVDNPHTKPFPFWQWMIAEVRARYPDTAFLAEAFTRPKVMNRLGKVGFSQSYTYFTWRNTKAELTEYLTQLTTEAPRDFFRPHFFVNTPDINPVFLQNTTRAAFLIRAAAAATLSGLWGVYNGFELCEGTALAPGKEEYLDSEKFQIRHWDWSRPGNIVPEITRLNAIRRENPALRTHHGISFLQTANEAVLLFEKATRDRGNVVLVAISLDPNHVQTAAIDVPLWKWGLPDQGSLGIDDLAGGGSFTLSGRNHSITLTPDRPYLIWRAAPAS